MRKWQITITSSHSLLLPHFNPSNNLYDSWHKTSTNKGPISHHTRSFLLAFEYFVSQLPSCILRAHWIIPDPFQCSKSPQQYKTFYVKHIFILWQLRRVLDTTLCLNNCPSCALWQQIVHWWFLNKVEAILCRQVLGLGLSELLVISIWSNGSQVSCSHDLASNLRQFPQWAPLTNEFITAKSPCWVDGHTIF